MKYTMHNEQTLARAIVKDCLQGALARLGGEEFFYQMGISKSGEDRRCLAMIMSKLIPSEVVAHTRSDVTVEVIKVVLAENGDLVKRTVPMPMKALPRFLPAPEKEIEGEIIEDADSPTA